MQSSATDPAVFLCFGSSGLLLHVSGVSIESLAERRLLSNYRSSRDMVLRGQHVSKNDPAITALRQKSSPKSLVTLGWPRKLSFEVVRSAQGWLCGLGNEAAYGPCVASSYHRLEVFGPLSVIDGSKLHPGLLFTVSVFKLDTYGQV